MLLDVGPLKPEIKFNVQNKLFKKK